MKKLNFILAAISVALIISCGEDSKSSPGLTEPTVSKPIADFSISCGDFCYDLKLEGTESYTAEAPVTIHTTNLSSKADSYLWDFGDGFTTTKTGPSREFNSPGFYTIRLTATNSAGSHTAERYLTVEKPPHWVLVDSSTFSLSAGYVSWYGPTIYDSYSDSSVGKKYTVKTSDAVDIRVMPNRDEYEHFIANESFKHYRSMYANNVMSYSEEGNISTYSIIVISNENLFSSITVTRKVYLWSEGKMESYWSF